MSDEPFTPLPDGRLEHKILVDRKKLESMMIESFDGLTSTAANFFNDVSIRTGAEVLWPSQLKIGAKTKKDPHVKVVGSLGEIHMAKTQILEVFQIKKERMNLKMDIHHSHHSHMIGKSGRQIQQVMNSTECHIHFPDSNKYFRDNEKNDQVSISGSPNQVLAARNHLKMLYPIIIKTEVAWGLSSRPDLPVLPLPSTLTLDLLQPNLYSITMKTATTGDEYLTLILKKIADALFMPIESLQIQTDVLLGSDTMAIVMQKENSFRIASECTNYGVIIEVVQSEQKIHLFGPATEVIRARSMILFSIPESSARSNIQYVESECGVSIHVKRNVGEKFCKITIKGSEGRFDDITRARQLLLPMEERKSPDPDESPLAASLLNGAKELTKKMSQRGDWILKATTAMQQKNTPSTRYPTDLWSGFGFSSSLPADLLKGMMDFSPSNSSDFHLVEENEKQRQEERSNERLNMNRLCALREDDELSDFCSSRGSFAPPVFNFYDGPRPSFSASTSVFDSSPLGSDFSWDIRVYTDPSMVLARLGCSEYVTQLREQEIDIHAFLLLDEQNLKDIGVSTIGARKKIHHAILKLRESARARGFEI